MMPASKHGDPQVGVDIHLCTVPPSPSPVPLPTPHTSVVFDPFDYVPILGATVTVCGMKRATAGTGGTAIHIPPGFPFAPKLPDKDDEIFMGSSTVTADGEPFSFTAVPTLSCQVVGMPSPPRLKKKGPPKLMQLPTTVNLAIPTNVIVGGPPTISLMGLAFKFGFAALGRFAKSGLFKKMRVGIADKLGLKKPGFLRCKILHAEPVCILNGSVDVEQLDFNLPGRIPIDWVRTYRSDNVNIGLCGPGWETLADTRLTINTEDGYILVHCPDFGLLSFQRLPIAEGEDAAELELMDGSLLVDHGSEYRVTTKDDRIYHFPKNRCSINTQGQQYWMIGRISDRCGNTLDFEYRAGKVVAINESSGRRLSLTIENERLTSVALVHPASGKEHTFVRYEYDAEGDLVTVIDALGAPYRFVYDSHHIVRHTDRNGLSFYYEYEKSNDQDWRVVHAWGDGGLYDYTFEYLDELNERRITDSLKHVSIVKLNEAGLPISEIDPLGGMTIFEYDDCGRTTAVVDQDQHRTEYVYDERGNLLKLTRPDGACIETVFDPANKAIKITDPNGAAWHQQWDECDLLVRQVTPLNAESSYQYDPLGQLVGFTNPRGAQTSLYFDGYGNLTCFTDALGYSTVYTYDHLGNLASKTDALDQQTLYTYDVKGRLTGVTFPSGVSIACAYDYEDNLIRYQDENGAVTQLEYCGLGEIKRRVQPDGYRVEYHYDTEERLIGVTNQRGERYDLNRDALGRIVEEVDYWGQVRQYTYTGSGFLKESIDPLKRLIQYEIDPLGRIIKKILPDPFQADATQSEIFEYDANGNLAACENTAIRIERRFDEEGQLIEEKQGETSTIANDYDLNGNRIKRTTSVDYNGKVHTNIVSYQYDALDQVTEVEVPGHHPIQLTRNALGQVTKERLSQNLERGLEYSPDGYMTAQQVTASETPFFEQSYRYDKAGNLVEKQDSVFGMDKYTYDPAGRITSHLNPEGQLQHYLNDPAGDWLITRVKEPIQDGLSIQKWGREGSYEGTYYRFDRAGNLVERKISDGVTQFTWDANQRLVKSALNERVTNYQYDCLGRRFSKKTDGVITRFSWDGDALLGDALIGSENASVNSRLREWVYYPETFEPLMMIHGGGEDSIPYFYHNDPNGCPGRLFNNTGDLVWAAQYNIWGSVEWMVSDQVDNPIRLQGQYEDKESGLYYNRNRYFSADFGLFVQPDPLGLRAGINLYFYAPNAMIWSDPLGLSCKFKMQPYRYSDVRVKGPHGDVISKNGYKITEGRLVIESESLIWKRFGDMGKATKKELKEADRLLRNLISDETVMRQARDQVDQVIEDLTRDLTHKNKNTRELAKRQLEYFKKMRGLF